MRIRTLFTCVAIVTCSSQSWAGEWDRDYEGWLQIVTEGNLDAYVPKLRLSLDMQSRFANTPRAFGNDDAAHMNPNVVVLLRPAVGVQIASWVSTWLGYTWQPVFFFRRESIDISEHRIFQQGNFSYTLGPVALSARTRIEERYRDKGGEGQGEGMWAGRLRQQFRAQWTLVPNKPWSLIVWDEIFFHLNTTGVFATNPDGTRKSYGYPSEAGFDQNRAFMGIGYQASPTLRVEMGYLNQIVARFGRSPDQINHILFMGAFFKFGDTPKKK